MKKILSIIIALVLMACLTGKTASAFGLNKESDEIWLPVVMYHQIYPSDNSKYRVSPIILDNDLTELTKQGFTTVFTSEIIEFVEGKRKLPEKPVLITFDDGHYNNVFYGEEILKKHNAKAIINVVGSFSQFAEKKHESNNPRHSYLTWEQIRHINKDVFEIGNHTYNLHKYRPRFGMKQLKGEVEEIYKMKINEDVNKMQHTLIEKANVKPLVFAYPFGEYNERVESYLAESGFKILLTCNEYVNKLRAGQPFPLVLGRFNRGNNYTSEQFVKKLSK